MQEQDYTELSRRADPERPDVWCFFCGDINAGWIGKVATVNAQSEWIWSAGLYPGSLSGEIKNRTGKSFDEAKARFERVWILFASSRTPEDFEPYREQPDWTARKYATRSLANRSRPVVFPTDKYCAAPFWNYFPTCGAFGLELANRRPVT